MLLKKNDWREYIFFFASIILAILLFVEVSISFAQEYPTRPIKIILPYGPGGINALIWRSVGDSMAKTLGQPVIIENKPGGGMTIAFTLVANAKPDGYTTGAGPASGITNSYLAYETKYHPLKSFTLIGGVLAYNQIFVTKSDSRWKSWAEFSDYVKKHPDEIKVGFASPVENATNVIKWIARKDGLKWKEVNFNSEPEEIAALLGGHIDVFPGSGVAHTLIKDGRARVLLAITRERIPTYPDVPTVFELYGVNAFQPNGLIAPAGLSKSIVTKLENALYEATKTPEYQKTVDQMGCVVRFRNSEEFTRDIKNTLETQKELIKAQGLLRKDLE